MAEVMHNLVTEAKRNRFSAIPKLTEEGKFSSKSASDFSILPRLERLVSPNKKIFFVLKNLLTKLHLLWSADVVNVWDNVSQYIERQMGLQKVSIR